MGKPRASEGALAIDTAGEVADGGDLTGKYANAVELGRKLAASDAGASCALKMMFRFANGRTETADDQCALDALKTAFKKSEGSLRQLVVEVVQSDAFRYRMGGN